MHGELEILQVTNFFAMFSLLRLFRLKDFVYKFDDSTVLEGNLRKRANQMFFILQTRMITEKTNKNRSLEILRRAPERLEPRY
jgi:hypothetical protein